MKRGDLIRADKRSVFLYADPKLTIISSVWNSDNLSIILEVHNTLFALKVLESTGSIGWIHPSNAWVEHI